MKAVMEFRPSAVSLKIWLSETTVRLTNSDVPSSTLVSLSSSVENSKVTSVQRTIK